MPRFVAYTSMNYDLYLEKSNKMELPEFLHDLTGGGDRPSLKYASEIFSMLEVIKVKKKQVLLHLGEVCDNIYFIKSNYVRT